MRQGKRRWIPRVRAMAAVAAFLVWTLAPFDLRAPDFDGFFSVALDDLAGNVLVTVAMGWLLADAFGPGRAVGMVALLALLVEGAQVGLATRSPALSDLVANVGGALGGAIWWHRRDPEPVTGQAMLILTFLWAVAARYGAPGRPVVTVGIFAALGVTVLLELQPRRWSDIAGFALVGTGGLAGLSPARLTVAALTGVVAGIALARPLRHWRRWIAGAAPLVLVLETWPPGQVARRRASDPALMVVEVGLALLTAALFLINPRRSPRGRSDNPARSSG